MKMVKFLKISRPIYKLSIKILRHRKNEIKIFISLLKFIQLFLNFVITRSVQLHLTTSTKQIFSKNFAQLWIIFHIPLFDTLFEKLWLDELLKLELRPPPSPPRPRPSWRATLSIKRKITWCNFYMDLKRKYNWINL